MDWVVTEILSSKAWVFLLLSFHLLHGIAWLCLCGLLKTHTFICMLCAERSLYRNNKHLFTNLFTNAGRERQFRAALVRNLQLLIQSDCFQHPSVCKCRALIVDFFQEKPEIWIFMRNSWFWIADSNCVLKCSWLPPSKNSSVHCLRNLLFFFPWCWGFELKVSHILSHTLPWAVSSAWNLCRPAALASSGT